MSLRSITCVLFFVSVSVAAAPRQEANALLAAVKNFVLHSNAGARGTIEMEVNAVDLRLSLPDCAELQAFRPDGAGLTGSTSVGVRCVGATSWTVVLPVRIQVTGYYFAAAHPIERGQVLRREDFVAREGDLTQLPPDALNTLVEVVGKVTAISIASGEALQPTMIRASETLQARQQPALPSRGQSLVTVADERLWFAVNGAPLSRVRSFRPEVVAGVFHTRFAAYLEY